MSQESKWAKDLNFVRGVVDPASQPHLPRSVALVWAIVVLIGFPLPDFVAGDMVLRYWLIAGPIAFLLCAFLGARMMHKSGQQDRRAAKHQFAHWGAFLAISALALLLPQAGVIDWQAAAPLLLLLISFAYLLAGIHLDSHLAWPGVAFAVGYCLLIYRVSFAWTIVGVLAALALVLTSEIGRLKRVAQAA